MKTFHCHIIDSINKISPADWHTLFDDDYPFIRHEFLSALEQSGATVAKTGWQAQHLLIYQEQTLIAAMPCYLKSHSYGEYIFDWSWAEAYQANGLEFYPKLVNCIPYTPATGPRLGVHPQYLQDTKAIIQCIDSALMQLIESHEASNWQSLFSDNTLHQQFNQQGWLSRTDVQFHWFNQNYQNFEHFVEGFTSRKRKNVLKERRKVQNSDIEIKILEGKDINEGHWQAFFMFYQLTYLKRSRHGGYLNQDFFLALGDTMAENIIMVIAQNQQEIVAASLFFKSDDTLYGRYWGCSESHQFLHFECCYYQGIDYCIANKIKRFDAGAQGEHKLQRGFEPVTTYANYHIINPQFSQAIESFLQREQAHIEDYIESAKQMLPYKSE